MQQAVEIIPIRTNYNYTPLPAPIPLTEQQWPEGTLPLVTTRTITYMHEPFIRACIEGILMQKTTFPVQVVIHDDASIDKTAEIVREYETKYPWLIKGIYQKENQFSKPGRGTMRGDIQAATLGKYVAFCEGDDYWTDPLKLQKQIAFLEENEAYSGCFHDFFTLKDGILSPNETIKNIPDSIDFQSYARDSVGIQTLTVVYRNFLTDIATAKIQNRIKGSKYLFLRLVEHGPLKFFSEPMAVYRIHQDGVWSGATPTGQADLQLTNLTAMIFTYEHMRDIQKLLMIQYLQKCKYLLNRSKKTKNIRLAIFVLKHIVNTFWVSNNKKLLFFSIRDI